MEKLPCPWSVTNELSQVTKIVLILRPIPHDGLMDTSRNVKERECCLIYCETREEKQNVTRKVCREKRTGADKEIHKSMDTGNEIWNRVLLYKRCQRENSWLGCSQTNELEREI